MLRKFKRTAFFETEIFCNIITKVFTFFIIMHHCWIKVNSSKNLSFWPQTVRFTYFTMFKSIYPKSSEKVKQVCKSCLSLTHISSFGDLKVYGRSRFPLFPPLQVVQESELWQCRAVAHHLLLSVQSCLRMPPKTPAERRIMTTISMERWITDIWLDLLLNFRISWY